jgi:hypothetical protein
VKRRLRQKAATKDTQPQTETGMSTVLDLFIQDFVTTNKLLGQHWTWDALSSRRLLEAGPARKVFEFTSGGTIHTAIGQWLALPDGDWFRIELTLPHTGSAEDHRFDCLRLVHQHTHSSSAVDVVAETATIVRLTTRHRGLLNLLFVVRNAPAVAQNPYLIS